METYDSIPLQGIFSTVLIIAKTYKFCNLVVYALKATKFENWFMNHDFFYVKIPNKLSFSRKDVQKFFHSVTIYG